MKKRVVLLCALLLLLSACSDTTTSSAVTSSSGSQPTSQPTSPAVIPEPQASSAVSLVASEPPAWEYHLTEEIQVTQGEPITPDQVSALEGSWYHHLPDRLGYQIYFEKDGNPGQLMISYAVHATDFGFFGFGPYTISDNGHVSVASLNDYKIGANGKEEKIYVGTLTFTAHWAIEGTEHLIITVTSFNTALEDYKEVFAPLLNKPYVFEKAYYNR